MKKRIFAILLIVLLVAGTLAACGKKGAVTQEEAQKIALEFAGLTEDQITDVHTHIVTEQGIPCYSIHITTTDSELSVVINAATGEVME